MDADIKNPPKTLQEALAIDEANYRATGQRYETVPGADDNFFNLVDRTVATLERGEGGSIVQVVTSCDTGEVVHRKVLIDPRTLPPEFSDYMKTR